MKVTIFFRELQYFSDQARFPGADGLRIILQDNDKRMRLLKRGVKVDNKKICAI